MTESLHSPEVLEHWARTHLAYELGQLAGTAVVLSVDGMVMMNITAATVVRNALLESILTHARTLDEFLRLEHTSRQKRPDSILAVDYLPTRRTTEAFSQATRRNINASLSHASVLRPDVRLWNEVAIARDVLAAFENFVRELSDPKADGDRVVDPECIAVGVRAAGDLLERAFDALPYGS